MAARDSRPDMTFHLLFARQGTGNTDGLNVMALDQGPGQGRTYKMGEPAVYMSRAKAPCDGETKR